MRYVTHDALGNLTGCYLQDIAPEHAGIAVPCTEEQAAIWTALRWDGSSLVAKPTTVSVDEIANRIREERDRRKLEGGYMVNVSGVDKWFHSDTFSRTQQLGLVLLGSNIPSGVQWKTMDGSFVTMSQTLAGQIFSSAAQQDIATFEAAETHIAAMTASANPAAYDYSGGWPAIYTGA